MRIGPVAAGSFGECLLAEEAGEAFEDGRRHVRMRRRAGAGLNEEVAMFFEEILIDRSATVSEEFLLIGP